MALYFECLINKNALLQTAFLASLYYLRKNREKFITRKSRSNCLNKISTKEIVENLHFSKKTLL